MGLSLQKLSFYGLDLLMIGEIHAMYRSTVQAKTQMKFSAYISGQKLALAIKETNDHV